MVFAVDVGFAVDVDLEEEEVDLEEVGLEEGIFGGRRM